MIQQYGFFIPTMVTLILILIGGWIRMEVKVAELSRDLANEKDNVKAIFNKIDRLFELCSKIALDLKDKANRTE